MKQVHYLAIVLLDAFFLEDNVNPSTYNDGHENVVSIIMNNT